MKEFIKKHPYLFWELIGIVLFVIYIIYAASTPTEEIDGTLGGIAILEMTISPIIVFIVRKNSPSVKEEQLIKQKQRLEQKRLSENLKEQRDEEKKIIQERKDIEKAERIAEEAKWNKIIKNHFEVNEEEKQIRINDNIYNFSDILEAELIEDGNAVIKSSLLGTAAKGFLFGAAGLMSKSKKTQNFCSKLYVKITIKDLNNPVEYIKLIKFKTPKNGFAYKSAYEQAQKCLSIINIIISTK